MRGPTERSSRSRTPATASIRTRAARSCTPRRTLRRRSSPSRSRRDTGRSTYRGLCKGLRGCAPRSKSNVECDALLINETSRTDTYPYIEIEENDANVGHEASVSKIGEEQLFYLTSRGIPEDEAMAMIVRGFIEPIAKELPLEYAWS